MDLDQDQVDALERRKSVCVCVCVCVYSKYFVKHICEGGAVN